MLDNEFYYYRANQDKLLKDYNGRYIVKCHGVGKVPNVNKCKIL